MSIECRKTIKNYHMIYRARKWLAEKSSLGLLAKSRTISLVLGINAHMYTWSVLIRFYVFALLMNLWKRTRFVHFHKNYKSMVIFVILNPNRLFLEFRHVLIKTSGL